MTVKRAKTSRRTSATAARPKSSVKAAPARKVAARTARSAKQSAQRPVKPAPLKAAPLKLAKTAARKTARGNSGTTAARSQASIAKIVADALDEMKAVQVKVLDVRKLTDIADTLIIASGNSDRHVRSIAGRIIERVKQSGLRPTGVEGERDGEWVLVDLQDVIVHIMLPRVREFYRLESLWDISAARREASEERVATG